MVEQTLVEQLEDLSLQQAMIMMHQLMNTVKHIYSLNVENIVFCLFDLVFCFAIFLHHFGGKLGLVRQPKWGHLKELHKAIKQCENTLLFGNSTLLTFGPLQEVDYFSIWFSLFAFLFSPCLIYFPLFFFNLLGKYLYWSFWGMCCISCKYGRRKG